jgi:hypothetical protein
MAADFAWALPQVARWANWGAWLAAVGLTLFAFVLRPLARRAGALGLAGVAERSYPQLGERLTGTVGLLGGGLPHGSPALIAALAGEAAARAGTVDPRRAVPLQGAARRFGAGLLALGLVTAPALVKPDPFGTLARRFLTPWADIDRVGRFVIDVAPGDTVVAIGSDLEISARVRHRFGGTPATGGAWLEWTEGDNGTWRRVAMPEASASVKSAATRGFAATLPAIARSLTYRVASGSGVSRRFLVTAVEPPAIASLSARVEPPAYTKLPAATARNPGRIEAWEGSRVVLNISANEPVRAIEVDWPSDSSLSPRERAGVRAQQDGQGRAESALTRPLRGHPLPEGEGTGTPPLPSEERSTKAVATLSADRRSGTATLVADRSGPYTIALRDDHGLASRPEAPRQVVVRPDAPPVLAVRGPGGGEESSPDDALRVAIAARDDVAVASAELHYAIERARPSSSGEQEAGHVAAPLAGLGTRAARGEAALELSALGLKPGDRVSYRVRVVDNRPAPRGPNVVWSLGRSLAVAARAEPLLARQARARREAFRAKLDELKKDTAEVRREAEQLRYAADAAQRGNGSWDKARQQELARREADARSVEDRLQLLARDLEADADFRALARPARQVADVEAEAARARLDQARGAADPEARLDELRQADARLGAVGERLDELQRQFDALARLGDDRQQLRGLADREDALAGHADAVAGPADRARLDQLQAEQKGVEDELDALLRGSPELRADVLAARAAEADALARRARALAERQRGEARQATDLAKHAETLKALAAEQRAIEDDARRLALEVDRPLTENGRGRLNTDAVRQAVAPVEHGDLEQGRQRLEGAEAELRRLARDLEDVPGDLKALAWRLLRRQDALNGQVAEAAAEFRDRKEMTAADKAEMAARLKPLADRQAALAQVAAALTHSPAAVRHAPNAPPFPADAALAAKVKTRRAAEGLRAPLMPRDIEPRQNEARAALNRLADAVPDVWKLREPSRRQYDEARRLSDEAGRELEQHLRETAPRPDQPYDPARAAADLANRLAPVAQKQARAAEVLAATATEPRAIPQRDRAARHARALADALERTRSLAGKPREQAALRATLPALQAEAHAAVDRLGQKLNGQVPADDLADELAAEQQGLSREPAKPANRTATSAEQRRVASALRGLNVPDATLAKEEAVRLAERAAAELTDPARDPQPALREAAEGVEALARRLADALPARAATAALARAERGLNDPNAQADPEAAARRQHAIADELARLPLKGKGPAAERVERAAELADRARRTDDQSPVPLRPSVTALAEARGAAAEALERLAAGTPAGRNEAPARAEPGAPADPGLEIGPAHTARASDLARRERRVRERLQAILGDRVPPQQALRRESAAIGRDLADLRDRARSVSDRAQGPAQAAAQILGEEAPRVMDQASEHLAQGRPDPARYEQRHAAEVAERGAQQAEDLAAALRADRPAEAQARAGAPGPLGEAREALRQAGRRLAQARDPAQGHERQTVRDAGQAMRQAARGLRAAARPAEGTGDAPGPEDALAAQDAPAPGRPDSATRDPRSAPAGTAAADLSELKDLVRRKTGRTWGELPGHLRTEILQMSQGRYRDDYARLIQLYFREIAAGASGKEMSEPAQGP